MGFVAGAGLLQHTLCCAMVTRARSVLHMNKRAQTNTRTILKRSVVVVLRCGSHQTQYAPTSHMTAQIAVSLGATGQSNTRLRGSLVTCKALFSARLRLHMRLVKFF